jgi:hypothetical protein
MGSFVGVDPCVEPNLTLFASFYILSILLSVENFDASSHFDLDLSQLEKICPLLQFEFVILLAHFKSVLFCCILNLLLLATMLLILMMLFLLILLVMFD